MKRLGMSKELGSGAIDYDLRLRFQRTLRWFTGIANAGYTFVGEPKVDGIRQKRRDVLFFAFAQEYKITERTKLLSEIYWKNSDEPHVSHRFAGDVGFKYRLLSNIAIHAAIGKSLRQGNLGGPRLRNRYLVSYPGKHLYDAIP
ncbi:MAG: hypothetical protein Q8R31_01230 [Candidatus Omnitrophota bacterium]|nr:hypothetical protein [Candidatus Omnitrophota bacterium]